MAKGALVLDQVSKSFLTGGGRERLEVVQSVSFEAEPSAVTVLMGPSGCGKTTILRLMCFLSRPDSGSVGVKGLLPGEAERGTAVVFQSGNCFPWLTVRQNILFPVLARRAVTDASKEVEARIEEVGLGPYSNFLPARLSGGMQQRVAIARLLMSTQPIWVLDEGFGALDLMVRESLRQKVRTAAVQRGKILVVSTHSISEAVALADKIVVFTRRPARIAFTIDVASCRVIEDWKLRLGDVLRRLLSGGVLTTDDSNLGVRVYSLEERAF